MPREPARPAAPRFTAQALTADLDPRICIVDVALAEKLQTRHTQTFAIRREPGDERDVPNVV
ncbi:MAG TPA: hypothetical protein VGB85_19735 [Nannocystis sp.]